jgi:nicotinamidase-related amidase
MIESMSAARHSSSDRPAELGQPGLASVRELVGQLRPCPIVPASTAVVLVDLQVLDASREGSQALRAQASGQWEVFRPYFERVEQVVLPAALQLHKLANRWRMPTIFTRCRSQTASARDNGRRFRDFQISVPPNSNDAALLPQLRPGPEDLIVDKTTASAFWSTSLERSLRQMGISTLLIGGVVTSGCVESLVRDACDLDFGTVLIADACADRTTALHDEAIARLDGNFAIVRTVEEIARSLGGTAKRPHKLQRGAGCQQPAADERTT